MKNIRSIKFLAPTVILGLLLVLFGVGCSETPNTSVKSLHVPTSYILPSILDTFNAGQVHNGAARYILSKYDTSLYLSFPNHLSTAAVDSLFAVFATDSLQESNGPFSSSQLYTADSLFDTTFSQYLIAPIHHTQLASSVSSAETFGLLATDEGNFILNADSHLRACSTYSAANDTITSLLSQYHSTTWLPSTSNGFLAYEYLSVANGSSSLWDNPSGAGNPTPCESVADDATGFVVGFGATLLGGGGFGQAVLNGITTGLTASFGVIGTFFGAVIGWLFG